MKKLYAKMFLILALFQVTIVESISVHEILKASERFAHKICDFPTQSNRIKSIPRTKEIEAKIEQQANDVEVIVVPEVLELIKNFLEYKKNFGSNIEKSFYKKQSLLSFLQRLIKDRPLVFCGPHDHYKLRSKDIDTDGCFENIGTECEEKPLVLHNYLSYSEMQIAAFLGVAVPTFFINNGSRFNKAVLDLSEEYQKEGIYVGVVGARFEKPDLMEWQHMIITPEQNTASNGYGLRKKDSTIWEKFYQEKFPTFQEAKNENFGKYLKIKDGLYLNMSVYKKRLKFVIKPFLKSANEFAQKYNKKAYCRVVGLGLGVWKISDIQEDLMLEVYEEILREEEYLHISDIEFLYFNKDFLSVSKNCSINISFSKANPADKLIGKDENKLLVAMYAWDGNSYPGNEYWDGSLTESGDPAAACCSTIAELQNPLINRVVLDSCKKLIN